MQESGTNYELTHGRWDTVFMGPILDARGKAAVEFASENTARSVQVNYNPDDVMFSAGGRKVPADGASDVLHDFRDDEILLEATTLSFAEIFVILRALVEVAHRRVTLLYVEPERYSNARDRNARLAGVMNRRDFELSEGGGQRYRAIPGATLWISGSNAHQVVFLLGYEQQRLERALEDFNILGRDCAVVFGVPAFKPGWEMNAFANNLGVIERRKLQGGIHYVGAENPAATVELLTNLRLGLTDGQRLIVAPIGTKPTGVGVALFAAIHSDVGLLYDHPIRKEDRSRSVDRWHLFEVDLFGTP